MLIKRFIGVSLFLLFYMCPIGAQSPPAQQNVIKPIPKQDRTTTSGTPTKTGQHEKNPANHQGTANKPTIPAEEQKPRVENDTPKSHYDYEAENLKIQRQLSKSTKTIAYFTIALVFVGVFEVIVFLIQVFLLRGTLKATKVAADAAKESAQVARDTLTSTRRAFVSLKHITAEPVMISRGLEGDQEAQHWMFSPCWVNMGDTPTKKLTISINHKVFDNEIPPEFDFHYDNRPNAITNIPMAIGPKGEVICGAFGLHYIRIIKPLQDLQTRNLYIWGEAIYNDIFSDEIHCTRFCVKMLFLGQQIVGKHNVPTFIHYDRYNCFDEDCDEQS